MTVLWYPARTIAPLLTALLFAVPSARAGQGAFSIQMFPFSVPVTAEDGRRATASIAIYLDVREEGEANTVCKWTPRIRDIVNQYLFTHPIRLTGRQLDMGGADAMLHEAIAAAIESDLVVAVHVARGTRPVEEVVGENTVLGCRLGKSGKVQVKKQKRKIGDVFENYR